MFVRNRFMLSAVLVVILNCIFLSSVQAQGNNFKPCEIILDNATTIKGYVWLADQINGSWRIFYKPDMASASIEYSTHDVVSISLEGGKKMFFSEPLDRPDGGSSRELMEMHFQGDISLLSLNMQAKKLLFIAAGDGSLVELTNSILRPDWNNDFSTSFNNEYQNVLRSFLNDPDFDPEINETSFSTKSISKLLMKYHKKRDLQYSIYPPPPISGFAGAGPSISFLKSNSDIDKNLLSFGPLFGARIFVGFAFYKDLLEINFESHFHSGIQYLDEELDLSSSVIGYYEDRIDLSLISNSLSLSVNPLSLKDFKSTIAFGVSYNSYLSFSRSLAEEVYSINDNTVVTNLYDNFPKPESFIGKFVRLGVAYKFQKTGSLRLDYSYNIYGVTTGPESMQSISISLTKQIF